MYQCLPLSISEIKTNTFLKAYEEKAFEKSLLEDLLIFGAYPEVYAKEGLSDGQKTELLENIVDAYVLKDIIDIYKLKDTDLAGAILTKIALQLGSEVSIRETTLRPDRGGVFENFIISELEKRRRILNIKVNFYFYREYGGKEVDLVIEDYYKNYATLEIKVDKGQIKDIFPLPNKECETTISY